MKRPTRDVAASLIGASLLVGLLVVVGLIFGDAGESVGTSEAQAVVPPTVAAQTSVVGAAAPSSSAATSTVASGSSSTTTSTTTTMPVIGTGGMSISFFESTDPDLWEKAAGECSSNPQTGVISATVSGPSAVSAVVLGWGLDLPDTEMEWEEMPETAPGVYSLTIGPFDQDTVDSGETEEIFLAVEAVDAVGNVAYADPPPFVTLHDCQAG